MEVSLLSKGHKSDFDIINIEDCIHVTFPVLRRYREGQVVKIIVYIFLKLISIVKDILEFAAKHTPHEIRPKFINLSSNPF